MQYLEVSFQNDIIALASINTNVICIDILILGLFYPHKKVLNWCFLFIEVVYCFILLPLYRDAIFSTLVSYFLLAACVYLRYKRYDKKQSILLQRFRPVQICDCGSYSDTAGGGFTLVALAEEEECSAPHVELTRPQQS